MVGNKEFVVFYTVFVPLFAWRISTINKIRYLRSGKEFWARICTLNLTYSCNVTHYL